MRPDLQASLLCDDVRQERNGKFILIGLFEGLVMNQLPGVFARICLINRWCCGQGEFTQRSRIIGTDGRTALCEGQAVPIRLADEAQVGTSVEIFLNIQFPQEGTYWVEILLDQHLRMRYPLHVRLVKPPPTPPPAA